MATENPSAKVGSQRTAPGLIGGWALVAIFALLTAATTWGVSVVYRGFTESALALRAATARLGAAALAEKFNTVLQLGTSLATRVRFRVHLEAGDWTRAARILDEVPAHFAFARRFELIDPQGLRREFAPQGAAPGAPELAGGGWFGEARSGRPTISGLSASGDAFVAAVPIMSAAGALLGVLAIEVDAAKFFQSIEALSELPHGFYVFDPSRTPVARLAQHTPERERAAAIAKALQGKPGVETVSDPLGQAQLAAYAPAEHTGWGVLFVEPAATVFAARDRLLALSLASYLAAGGALLGFFFYRSSVRAASERAALHADERLRAAVGALDEGIVLYDAEDRLVLCNERYREIYRDSADLLVPGARFEDIIREGVRHGQYPRAAGREEAWIAERMAAHRAADSAIEQELAGGRWLRIAERRTPDGGTIGSRTDITQQKRAERALAELNEQLEARVSERTAALVASEALYRASSDSTSAAIFIQRGDRIVRANPAASRITGYSVEELLGFELRSLLHPDSSAAYLARSAQALAGEGNDDPVEVRFLRKDGAERSLSVTMRQVSRLEGAALFVTAIDVTALKQTEARLADAQKMEVIGRLTGGLAHDFNNVFGVILGNLDLLAPLLENAAPAQERLARVNRALDLGMQLTKTLLAVARQQSLAPERVDLVARVRSMIELFRTTCGATIEVVDRLGEAPKYALVDPAGLGTAMLNLVVNARDAILGNGKVVLTAEDRTEDRIDIGSHAWGNIEPGLYTRIGVTDTGRGMTPDEMAHAPEPLFSTKPRGLGTGLGLAMVHGFCRQSGGGLRFYSKPGKGTTMWIYLPQAKDKAALLVPPREEEAPGRGQGRVLLVDDEAGILEVTREWLTGLGYTVSAFRDANAALRALAGERFDLLMTDVVMPPLDGFSLAAQARECQPGIAVVYMSGFSVEAFQDAIKPQTPMLQKPFRKVELARAVKSALVSSPPPRRST